MSSSLEGWRRWAVAAGAGLLALTGFLLVVDATRGGPGVTVDSGSYVALADGIRTGHGPTSPVMHYGEPYPDHVEVGERRLVTHFPPLYPAVVAVFGLVTGLETIEAARWLGAFVLAITTAWVTVLVGRRTGSVALALLGGGMVLATDVVRAHSMVWSEGVFCLVLLGTVLAAERYVRSPTAAARWILVALAAAGPLIRFVGIALPIGVALVVVVLGRGALRRRTVDAAVVGGLAVVPVGLWIAIAGIGRGSGSFRWHPPGAEKVLQGFDSIGRWVRLEDGRAEVVGVAVVAASVLLAIVWCRRVRASETFPALGAVSLLVAGVMIGVLALARVLVDALISFDPRMLAPFHVLAAVVVPLALAPLRPPWRPLAAAVGLWLVVLGLAGTREDGNRFARVNSTYTGPRWEASATMAAVRSLPDRTVVATNAPDAVWLRTGRAPLMLPLSADLYGGGANPDVRAQADTLAEALRSRDAIVVFFDRPTQGGRRVLDDRVVAALGLEEEQRYADGTTYRLGGS